MHTDRDASRLELYRKFLEVVNRDAQGERRTTSRRIITVFLWCFLAPAVVTALLFVLVKFDWVPRRVYRYADWMFLVFPTTYSLYFMAFEVFREFPKAVKRGGLGNVLAESESEAAWRMSITRQLREQVNCSTGDWNWVAASFRMDLRRILNRARYITALGGAVFFLLLQGIDSLGDWSTPLPMVSAGVASGRISPMSLFEGWFEVSSNSLAQFTGLGLFVLLLYLAGTRTYHQLSRYLDCVELMLSDEEAASGTRRSGAQLEAQRSSAV